MSTEELLIDTNALLDGWEIREALVADAPRLVQYLGHLASEPVRNTRYRPGTVPSLLEMVKQIRNYNSHPTSKMFLAARDGVVIGILFVIGNDNEFTRHSVELSLNVNSAYRGQGVGSRLIKLAMSWIRNQPRIQRVELHVLTRNEGAARLYERLGFVVEGRLKSAYRFDDEGGEMLMDALIMAHYPN